MKLGGGPGKGGAFERDTCKILSLWISEGADQELFWRSASSGGRATLAHRKGKTGKHPGDIYAISPQSTFFTDLFFVECKHRKRLQIDKFILINQGELAKFWQVCVKQAADHGRLPMLIGRENGKPTIVVTQPRSIYRICEARLPLTYTPEIRLLSELIKAKVKRSCY